MACQSGRVLLVLVCVAVSLLYVGCGGPTPTTMLPPPTATPLPPTQAPLPTATSLPTIPAPPPTATLTPTPTSPAVLQATAVPTTANACSGYAGALEIQVLVGPAEAVGLEPVAVGSVPLAAIGCTDVCEVQGHAPITYEAVQAHAWGTYAVSMDLEMEVSGTCSGAPGSETLTLTIVMTGEQMVEVRATGFSGDYPWSGTQTRDVVLPLQEGATVAGEGWGVVLHLGS